MPGIISTAIIALFILTVSGLKLDREYQRGVIFRLGRSKGMMGPGLYWIIPWIDQKVQIDAAIPN